MKTVEDRFWAKVIATDSCWYWTGATTNGYGSFQWRGNASPAHRFAYELLVGPIPDGLQLDHLCRMRACVNPAHLEPVTQRENLLRGNGWSGRHARQMSCKHGHPFTAENIYSPPRGGRQCRMCMHAKKQRQRMRRRELVPVLPHYNIRKTECPSGHPYSEENTYRAPDGRRECRMCRAAKQGHPHWSASARKARMASSTE